MNSRPQAVSQMDAILVPVYMTMKCSCFYSGEERLRFARALGKELWFTEAQVGASACHFVCCVHAYIAVRYMSVEVKVLMETRAVWSLEGLDHVVLSHFVMVGHSRGKQTQSSQQLLLFPMQSLCFIWVKI